MTFGSMSKRLVLVHQTVDGRELKGPWCFDTPDLGYGALYPINTAFWDFVEWHKARRRTSPAGRSSIGRGRFCGPNVNSWKRTGGIPGGVDAVGVGMGRQHYGGQDARTHRCNMIGA